MYSKRHPRVRLGARIHRTFAATLEEGQRLLEPSVQRERPSEQNVDLMQIGDSLHEGHEHQYDFRGPVRLQQHSRERPLDIVVERITACAATQQPLRLANR